MTLLFLRHHRILGILAIACAFNCSAEEAHAPSAAAKAYFEELTNKTIRPRIKPPKLGPSETIRAQMLIHKDGSVSDVVVLSQTSSERDGELMQQKILDAQPFPPPPAELLKNGVYKLTISFQGPAKQTDPSVAPQTTESPKITKEESGNVTSLRAEGGLSFTQAVSCIPLTQARNSYTPPDLYQGVAACVEQEKYDLAARLFALAGIYGAFDARRVADQSAGQAKTILVMQLFSTMDPPKKRQFDDATKLMTADAARMGQTCSEVRSVGMPSYYPAYMINHGIKAFAGNPNEGALTKDFNSSKVWINLQTSYLKCPSAQEIAAAVSKPSAAPSRDTSKDVAIKVATMYEDDMGYLLAMDFNVDGAQLAVSGFSAVRKPCNCTRVHIWDWKAGKILRAFEESGGDLTASEPMRYSPDGSRLARCFASGADNVVVRIRDTSSWDIVREIVDPNKGICNGIAFTPDGKSLVRIKEVAVTAPGDRFFVYDTATWQQQWGLNTQVFYLKSLAISPDGKTAAVMGRVTNPVINPRFTTPNAPPPPTFGDPPMEDTPLIAFVDMAKHSIGRTVRTKGGNHISWSPDARFITYADFGEVTTLDAKSGAQINTESVMGSYPYVRYTPDAKYIIQSANNSRTPGIGIRIWDGQSGKLLQEIPGDVWKLAVSPDSKHFAISENQKVIVWQLK